MDRLTFVLTRSCFMDYWTVACQETFNCSRLHLTTLPVSHKILHLSLVYKGYQLHLVKDLANERQRL